MSFIRKILSFYRKIQYAIYKRSEYGILPVGKLCTHTPFEEEINHGDVVHPCVRYIPEGYLGHKWWMVYTPYYASNDKTENPILCFSESNDSNPPTDWIVAYQVQGQPPKGYNSDPTLFYDNGKLYVFWRENLTERCYKNGYVRATFGAEVFENGIGEVFGPLVGTTSIDEDKEVSPTFYKCNDGKYRCYAMHLRFFSPLIQGLPDILKRLLNLISNLCDLLGIWSQQKVFGCSIWESDQITNSFIYVKTCNFSNCNKLYRPWHMDLFEYQGHLYAIIQTNQCNADICLAYSDDFENFVLHPKSLITNATIQKIGIYKPTAGVVNNNFFLYYTAQDIDNRALNKLYLVTKKI